MNNKQLIAELQECQNPEWKSYSERERDAYVMIPKILTALKKAEDLAVDVEGMGFMDGKTYTIGNDASEGFDHATKYLLAQRDNTLNKYRQ